MKKIIGIVLVLIALGLGGIVFYYGYYIPTQGLKQDLKEISGQNNTSTTQAGEYTYSGPLYKNSKLGFQVGNPDNLYVQVEGGGEPSYFIRFFKSKGDADYYKNMVYSVMAEKNNSYFEDDLKDVESGKLTGSKTQIADEPAIKVTYTESGGGYYYIVLHDNYIYQLNTGETFVESNFRSFIDSFKFTN